MRYKVVSLLFGVMLAQAANAAPAGVSDRVVRGESYAQEHCSTCHAVGRTGTSPYAQAPPFRTLPEKYDVANLAEALAEGIVVANTGVRQMPQFVLSVDEIEDLIAYLKSLDTRLDSFQPNPAGSTH